MQELMALKNISLNSSENFIPNLPNEILINVLKNCPKSWCHLTPKVQSILKSIYMWIKFNSYQSPCITDNAFQKNINISTSRNQSFDDNHISVPHLNYNLNSSSIDHQAYNLKNSKGIYFNQSLSSFKPYSKETSCSESSNNCENYYFQNEINMQQSKPNYCVAEINDKNNKVNERESAKIQNQDGIDSIMHNSHTDVSKCVKEEPLEHDSIFNDKQTEPEEHSDKRFESVVQNLNSISSPAIECESKNEETRELSYDKVKVDSTEEFVLISDFEENNIDIEIKQFSSKNIQKIEIRKETEEEEKTISGENEACMDNLRKAFAKQYQTLEDYFQHISITPSSIEILKLSGEIEMSPDELGEWFDKRRKIHCELQSSKLEKIEKFNIIEKFHQNSIARWLQNDDKMQSLNLKKSKDSPKVNSLNTKYRRYQKQPNIILPYLQNGSKKFERASKPQNDQLTEFFENINVHPTEAQIEELTEKLDLSKKFIKKWFAKKRLMKMKDSSNQVEVH